MPVKPIPDGYHSITPYLIVHDATKALDFYRKAYGAEVLVHMPAPGGKVAHAEIRLGDSVVMLADESPQSMAPSPKTIGGCPVHILLYVNDCDAVFKQALAAGGKEVRPLKDQFYGDRSGSLEDPFGHNWTVATHVEDVTPEEMKRRMDEMMKGQGA